MKVALICFSGTGTTIMYAEEIRKGLKSKGIDADIFRMNKVNPQDLVGYDIFGFGSPTYSFTNPSYVGRFLKSFPAQKVPYFIFVTCGGNAGNTLSSMHSLLKDKMGPLLGTIVGIGSKKGNIRAWRPKTEEEAPDDIMKEKQIQKAHDFGASLPDLYQSIFIDKTKESPSVSRSLGWGLVNLFASYEGQMRLIEGKKQIDTERCTKCGLCANKICPSGSITQANKDEFPVINNGTCFGCSGCVNLCPVDAIYSNSNKNKHPYTAYGKYVLK